MWDPWSSGYGFESLHRKLGGNNIFSYIRCKNCNVCLKKTKINKNRPRMAHFLKFYLVGTSPSSSKVTCGLCTICSQVGHNSCPPNREIAYPNHITNQLHTDASFYRTFLCITITMNPWCPRTFILHLIIFQKMFATTSQHFWWNDQNLFS